MKEGTSCKKKSPLAAEDVELAEDLMVPVYIVYEGYIPGQGLRSEADANLS